MATQPDLHEAEKEEEALELEEEEAGVDEASLAAHFVKGLTAEEVNSILMEAYEKYPDVRDAVHDAFARTRRIFIHNVPVTAQPMDLYDRFVSFGEIVHIKILSGLTARVGYVVFEKSESAEKAANFPGQSASFLGSYIQWHFGSGECSLCEQLLPFVNSCFGEF